jgi:DNA invertase Pin-like site-specific DNA recombinase/ssDNA-binding Zn-finger/Zn-ribbon topoisomerase 1
MKRAAIYARVSTGKQAAGELSLPNQISLCEAYAKAQGFEVAGIFSDEGASARTDKRREFQRLINLALAAHRPIAAILAHSQSRLFRNAKDMMIYRDRLSANGVRLISITQDLGESDSAEALHVVGAVFDEYNSKETAKHVARSMIENAKQGFWNGSRAPFGYRTYTAEVRGIRNKKKIEIDEAEAGIVRQIFRLYVHGDGNSGPMGAKRIAVALNGSGARNRDGKPFRLQFIDKALRNAAYVGEHYFNRTDSRRQTQRPKADWVAYPMPRIVDDPTFYAAQEKLDRQHPMRMAPRLVSSEVLLTSVAKCGACGAPMRKQSGKRGQYHYYRCSKKCDSGPTACSGVSIAMGELDEIVLSAIEETILEPKRLRRMTEALVARAGERNEALMDRLRKLDGEKRKTKKQVDELYRRIGDGDIKFDATLKDHIEGLQQKHETLTRHTAHLETERSRPLERLSPERVEEFGKAVKAALRNPGNRQFARAYVQTLVSEVVVADDAIRIKGPKSAIAHQAAAFSARGELVPSFAQQWRARQDSN